ncbi:MAG: hypothetical protein IT488_01185 [Gammaproteobacteria bacterium]|nr:hypothetical protein [Gammaproteobacteria bacterium]
MIDLNRRLLFIHIARTGGTSIETACAGIDWCYIDLPTKHLSASQARAHYGEEIWNGFTKFSIVRNPWDRLVSMWSTGSWHAGQDVEAGRDMKAFLIQLRPHPVEKYQSLYYHEVLDEKLDYVLRYENLRDDLLRMLKERSLPPVLLPHVEATRRHHYSAYYSPEAAEIAGTMFRKDITDYGYRFESPSGGEYVGTGARFPDAGRFSAGNRAV